MTEFLFCLFRFTVKTSEGAAFGAALLAGVGVGTWKTIQQACEETICTLEHTTLRPKPWQSTTSITGSTQSYTWH
jgi:glycerol kinase